MMPPTSAINAAYMIVRGRIRSVDRSLAARAAFAMFSSVS